MWYVRILPTVLLAAVFGIAPLSSACAQQTLHAPKPRAADASDQIHLPWGGGVAYLAVSSDGKLLAANLHGRSDRFGDKALDGIIAVWRLGDKRLLGFIMRRGFVHGIEFVANTYTLAAASEHNVELWDLSTVTEHTDADSPRLYTEPQKELAILDAKGRISSIAGRRGSFCIAVGTWSDPSTVALLDPSAGSTLLWSNSFRLSKAVPQFVGFGAAAKRVYSSAWGIRAWEADSGRMIYQNHAHRRFGPIAVSPDGKRLAVGEKIAGGRASLLLLNAADGAIIQNSEATMVRPTSIIFLQSSRYVLVGAETPSLRVWDVANDRTRVIMKDAGMVTALRALPCKKVVAAAMKKGGIHFWYIDRIISVVSDRNPDQ